MKCRRGHEIRPLKSAAGWYWGTTDEDGFPYCRISTNYARTEEECLQIVCGDREYASEVEFCNNGKGCFSLPLTKKGAVIYGKKKERRCNL